MHRIAANLTELVGKTPMVSSEKIQNVYNVKGQISAKLEYFNPLGSIKDRVALAMIKDAIESNVLTKNSIIIEATSGNTGIGLAFVCAIYQYALILVMPETMSQERVMLLEALGAKIVLTEGTLGMKESIRVTNELKLKYKNSISLSQFQNSQNPRIHYETTGVEINEDTGSTVDVLVCGIGTGGTVTGVGTYLKEKNPHVKVVGVEPKSSAVLNGNQAGLHHIQGIGAGFIPEVLDLSVLDEVRCVSDEDAFEMMRSLARHEGLLVGISSGAVVHAAIQLLKEDCYENKHVVVILPDSGERYLSLNIY